MNLTEPDLILVNFLRSRITEVTRQGYNDRYTNKSQNYTATADQTAFVTTFPMSCVNSVVVDGVTMVPYLEYALDPDNKTVTLVTGASVGVTVTVDYETGTNWVYPDKPRSDLSRDQYPRIGVTKITESGLPQGNSEDDTYDSVVFQIDVLTFKDLLCTINSETKEGEDVVQYLARQVTTKLKTEWRSYLKNKLFNPLILKNDPSPFEPNKNIFRRIIEVKFNAFNIGE